MVQHKCLCSLGRSGAKSTIIGNLLISHGLTYLSIQWKNLGGRLKMMPPMGEDHLESLCVVEAMRREVVESLSRFVEISSFYRGLFPSLE